MSAIYCEPCAMHVDTDFYMHNDQTNECEEY